MPANLPRMLPVPARPSPGCPCPRSRIHRYCSAALIAVCAGALALVTACAGSGSGAGSGGGAAKPLTPRQAIVLASDQTQQASTLSARLSVQIGGAAAAATTGTLQYQLKPALLAHVSLTTSAGGKTVPVEEIMSTSALYLKVPALSAQSGKPWLEVSLSELSGNAAASLRQLFQNVANGNPQTQLRMLAASNDVRADGPQVVNGVTTTHYTGSVPVSAAIAALPAGARHLLGPTLSSITSPIHFGLWIDASHRLRQVTEVETLFGETVTTTVTISAINQPVHIAIPPPSQVTTLPQGALSGG